MPGCCLQTLFFTFAVLASLFFSTPVSAQEGDRSPDRLLVGTKVAPPFVIKTPQGHWKGISIELWQAMAHDLGVDYELKEYSQTELLREVAAGRVDLGLAALTITAEREKRLDFTYPFYTTGLAIVVPVESDGRGWSRVMQRFLSPEFLLIIGLLVLLLMGVGLLAWLLERRCNREMFSDKPLQGVGNGFWWAAVTMTTVGYGDKAPCSLAGRVLAVIWMFTSVIIISSFIAGITTSLTVEQLSGRVKGLGDLPNVRVGVVAESAGVGYLTGHGIHIEPFSSAGEGLQALLEGQVDAFVHDEPIMRYLVKTGFQGGLRVLPGSFDRQNYGIALPAGSPHRERLNRALLGRLEQGDWKRLARPYLGPEH